MTRYYAGIGSTNTPLTICMSMSVIAYELCEIGYTLRSGAADGADRAFEKGVFDDALKEIYLPYRGFNKHPSHLILDDLDNRHIAYESVSRYHPKPARLSLFGRQAMARNYFQIMGFDVQQPVDFVICWTPEGNEIGGTSQAIRIARDMGITVYNLGLKGCRERIDERIAMERFLD